MLKSSNNYNNIIIIKSVKVKTSGVSGTRILKNYNVLSDDGCSGECILTNICVEDKQVNQCLSCKNGVCFKCEEGFYLPQNECFHCPNSCETCSSED